MPLVALRRNGWSESSEYAWGNLSWEYDRIGSRKRETRGGVVDVYSYVPNAMGGNTAKLDEIALGAGGTKVYQFDAAGNQSQVTTGADVVLLSHDEANQLAAIERPAAGVRSEMLYDGRGFLRHAEEQHPGRIFADDFETGGPACWSAVVGGAGGGAACPLVPSVGPVYSSDGVLRYQLKEGGLERYVLYFAGRPVLMLAVPAGGAAEPLFLAADHLGTPILASDGAGGEVWAGGFEPVGLDYSGAGDLGIYLRLPGQWADDAWSESAAGSEIHYNLHRWYETYAALYLQPDPLGITSQGTLLSAALEAESRYQYVRARSTFYVDPLGLKHITHDDMENCRKNFLDCAKVIRCTQRADRATRRRFGTSGRNDASDAYRHCFTSCCLAQSIGWEKAKRWGDAHEEFPGNPECERFMDLFNNARGRGTHPWGPGRHCDDHCTTTPLQNSLSPNCCSATGEGRGQ